MDKRVRIFSSFEEENEAEEKRRASLNLEQRILEFSAIQERAWGKDWGLKPIPRRVSFETVSW